MSSSMALRGLAEKWELIFYSNLHSYWYYKGKYYEDNTEVSLDRVKQIAEIDISRKVFLEQHLEKLDLGE